MDEIVTILILLACLGRFQQDKDLNMKINNKISPQIIVLLQPYVPELPPQNLMKAIQNSNNDFEKPSPVKKTLTIPQTAEALQVSIDYIITSH